MDSDEPSLVPQWLKGGAGNGSAYGNKDTDFDPSQKKSPFATWDSRGPARRTVTTDARGVNDKSWKQPEQRSTQRDAFATARDNFTAPHRDFNTAPRDTYSKLSSGLSSNRSGPVRPSQYDRPNGFGDRLDDYGHAALRPRPGYGQSTSGSGPIALHRTESAPEARVREHHPDHDLLRGPPPKPSFDREFPSLARQTYVPREAPTKQKDFLSARTSAQWNSRLADAPAASPDPAPRTASGALSPFRSTPAAPPAPLSSPSSSSSTPATSPPSTTHAEEADGSAHQPRMSDTLQQTQASATAVDRTRLEQLAVKQSHKLIPVLASKAKAPGSKPQAATAAAVLSKPALLQRSTSLGHAATTTAAAARSAADLAKGGAAAAATATSATAPSNGLLTLKLAAPSGDRAKSRSNFFESLRRRAPSSDQSQQQDDAGDMSAAVSDLIGLHLVSLSTVDQQPDDQQHDQSAQPAAAAGVEADSSSADSPAPAAIAVQPAAEADAPAAVLAPADDDDDDADDAGQDSAALLGPSAEEEAFLRSLGWTEASDDEEDCGLTEEEIAAFKAAAELRAKLPSCKLKAGSHGMGLANGHCVDASAGCSSSDDESEV